MHRFVGMFRAVEPVDVLGSLDAPEGRRRDRLAAPEEGVMVTEVDGVEIMASEFGDPLLL